MNEADFDDCRSRWLAGLCPCCGASICEWEWDDVVWEPAAIAEGVQLCGRCIGNEHDVTPGFTELLLASLVP